MKRKISNPMRGICLTLLSMLSFSLFAQNVTLRGTVADVAGDPLIGVTVQVQGSTTGTVTDVDGNFTLLNVSPDAMIEVSYVGMRQQVIRLNGRTSLQVVLEEDTELLEEVVVVGYGTMRREAVTGSVSSMQGNVLRDVPTGNVTTALQGRLPGVQMQQSSSKPGADMQIRIRGTRSLNADNNPLVVLDGIPFAGTLSDINPNDIKSIDILKDASSTAIYGSRGANGVIMITTFKGIAGQKASVSYNAYYGSKTLYNRYPMMSGEELYELRHAAGIYKEDLGGGNSRPTLGADEVEGVNTDWQDLMFESGMMMSHDIGVTGGTAGGSYTFGAGYYEDESLLPGQDYSRINLRANIDQSIGKYLRFGLTTNNNYNVTNGSNLGMYSTLATSPMIDPYAEDGTLKPIVHSIADDYWTNTRERVLGLGDSYADNRRGYGSYNSLYGEVKIPGIEGLSYRINLGLNLRGFNRGQYQGKGIFSSTTTAASTGSLEKSLTYQWVVENIVTYDKNFDKHHLNFTGLYSEEATHYDRSLVKALNIPSDHFQYWNLGQASKDDVTVDPNDQHYEEYGLKSWMGRVMYDYDSRYMLSVALRSDGSSRLSPGYKWHTYPAISAGWNISRESFMENLNWINNLKLRLGWGQTSNQAVTPYATLGRLSLRPYNFGTTTTTGAYVSEVPNPELGWEFSSTYNIGVDFSLWNNRLRGSADYYIVNTNDLLMKVNLPSTAGVGSYWANIGKSQNKGFELALSGTIIDDKDGWSWDAGLNFYTNRNEIVELASGSERDEVNAWFKGYPINSIFDFENIGLWQEGDPYLTDFEPGGNVGMIKVKYTGEYDANGKPVRQIGAADRQIISADPDWLGGFNTRVAYNNWDLNVIGTYQHGGILVSSLHASNGYLNMLSGRRGNVKVDYWTPENSDAKYPKPGGIQSGDNPKYGSTLGYFDASYFKVGQISLGYNFDTKADWIRKASITNARIYFSIQNAFVLFSPFNDESGLDPVTNSYGDENAAVTTSLPYNGNTMLTVGTNTPQTRNFLVGINLTF
ncbi:MAG: SusC/RagA family protein [Bacteroidetes bacterium GWD2_45_23]|nr:MAG: SusC/RagA family protein [Bacteroidetes bacterium GWC2_46_850]OFX84109.1 MAG: SusC/RagA family protein [Bacteroidetes bacterium GWD2_45_23]